MANVGSIDRILRLIAGVVLIALPFMSAFLVEWGYWRYLSAVIGLVLILTAAFRFCPAYAILGIKTCKLR